MIRSTHRGLFRGGPTAVISEVYALDGWKGWVRGESENAEAVRGRVIPKLQKCALLLLRLYSWQRCRPPQDRGVLQQLLC